MPVEPIPCQPGGGGTPVEITTCCSPSIASTALCRPDGTTVLLVVQSGCAECGQDAPAPEVAGWVDTATGTYTPGALPADAGPCETLGGCEEPTQPVAMTGLCLADGTPISVVVTRDCAGTVTQEGWLDLTTGAWAAGAPPAGTIACGDSRSIQVSGTFCDIDPDTGDVLGLVLVEYAYAADGSIASVRLVDAVTGTTYTPVGEVTTCPAGVEQPERDVVQICDVAADGTVTPLVRDYARDENGQISGHTDYTLDGTPYTPTGTVGVCHMPETEPCASTVSTLRLCDLNPDVEPDADGKRCAVPFLRHLVHSCDGALAETRDTAMDGTTAYTPVEVVDCGSGGVPALSELLWPQTGIAEDPAGVARQDYIYTVTNPESGEVAQVKLHASSAAPGGCGTYDPANPVFNNPTVYTLTLDTTAQQMSTFRLDLLDFDVFEGITNLNPIPSRVEGDVTWNGSTIKANQNNITAHVYFDSPPAQIAYRYGNTGGGSACSAVRFQGMTLVPDGCCGCSANGGGEEPCRDTSSTLLCDTTTTESLRIFDPAGVADADGWEVVSFTGAQPGYGPTGAMPYAVYRGTSNTGQVSYGARPDLNAGPAQMPWPGYDNAPVRWIIRKTFEAPEDGTATVTASGFRADGGGRVRINGVDMGLYSQWGQPGVGGGGQAPVTAGPNVVEIEVRDDWGFNWATGVLDIVMTKTVEFLRRQVVDCETGQVVSVTDTTLDGQPYEVTGEVGQCEPVQECCPQQNTETIPLCDTTTDGAVTQFLRHLTHAEGGGITAVVDTHLDGATTYTPTGDVGTCGERCRDTSSTLLCDTAATDLITVLDPTTRPDADGWEVVSFTGYRADAPPEAPLPYPARYGAPYGYPALGARTDQSAGYGGGNWSGYDSASVRWVIRKKFTAPEDGVAVAQSVGFRGDGGARVRINGLDAGMYGQWNQPATSGTARIPVTAGLNTVEVEVRDVGGINNLVGRLDIALPKTVQFMRRQVTDCETGEVISTHDTTLDGDPYTVVGEVGECQPVAECCEPAPPEQRVDVETQLLCVRDTATGEVLGQVLVERVYDDQTGDLVEQRLTDPTTGDPVDLPVGAALARCPEAPCSNSSTILLCDSAGVVFAPGVVGLRVADAAAETSVSGRYPNHRWQDPGPATVQTVIDGGSASWGDTAGLDNTSRPDWFVLGGFGFTLPDAPECGTWADAGDVRLDMAVTVRNDGPNKGVDGDGVFALFNGQTWLGDKPVPGNIQPGISATVTFDSVIVAVADLPTVVAALALELKQGGGTEKTWTVQGFSYSLTPVDGSGTASPGCGVQFLRTVTVDCETGATVSSTDTTLDGDPYTVTGQVGQCTVASTPPAPPCGDTEVLQLCDLVYSPQAPIPTPAHDFTLTGNVVLGNEGTTLWFAQSPQPVNGVAELTVSGLLPAVMYEFRFASAWIGAGAPNPAANNAIYLLDILDGTTVLATRTRNTSNGSSVFPGGVLSEDMPPLAFIAPATGTVTIRFTDQTTGGAVNDRDLFLMPLELRTAVLTVTSTPFLRALTIDCDGAVTSAQDLTLTGVDPYVTQGVVGHCAGGGDGASAAPGTDTEVLSLCDVAGDTSVPFLRQLALAADGTVTVTDTALDGVTPYVPAGTVGTCPAAPCAAHVLEECRWDDTDGDGIGDTQYVELLTVDGCTGALSVLGSYTTGLTGPYTPVAPVAEGPAEGAPAARGVQARRVMLAAGESWDASAVALLQSVTMTAHGGPATIATETGTSTLYDAESVSWSVGRDDDAALVGPLTVTAGPGTVTVAYTRAVTL
ncbi:hypothetical protein [Streptomyces sp. NPDC054771]